MQLFRWTAALCLLGTLGLAQAEQKADPNLARDLAATCTGCHGSDGRAVPGAGFEALARRFHGLWPPRTGPFC